MSMSSVLTLPAPGWYPDPVGASTYRWWDGSLWTEGTHDGAADAMAESAVEPFAPAPFVPEPVALVEPEPEPEPEPLGRFSYGDAVFDLEQGLTAVEPMPIYASSFSDAEVLKPTIALLPQAQPIVEAAPPAEERREAPRLEAPATEKVTEKKAAEKKVRPAREKSSAPVKTRWSSMLVAFPFVYPIALGMIVALAYAGGSSTNMTTLAVIGGIAAVVLLAPAFILAENDRKELLARGYAPAPSVAWMLLLPPVVYLLMRRRVVGPRY